MAPRNAAPATETGFADWLKSKSEDEIKKLFPLTVALLQEWESSERPFLRIVSSAVAGFRRGGVSHVQSEAVHDLANFKPEQIEQILAEPTLIADLVPAPVGDAADKKPVAPASA
ncbi:MAG: hypothetical protein E6Q76_18640 [Rhizobium sp.]|nr:MAG: hypothetical protein E6Q76_18640 [Rhizobium sp.]